MTIATNLLASPDVFSMTDEALAKMYQFSEETGVGNWGSVWLGTDKRTSPSNEPKRVAIKVVHRSKTQTAAAQVRSLWNEMKVVRSFKEDPHPSIIVFESFIITPSYAIIVMPFLPKLLPVDIEEEKAKPWFAALSSAVCFLHAHGVVHNDIKPANILLTSSYIPTLVDFGFSEKYELESPDAFRTTLAYGTPEYLAPERAKGLTHDPRKSDIWSLGVTFFEISMGRTPFEKDGGEHFSTKDELDVYWSRTMKGKWVGAGSDKIKKRLSPGLESLLHRMLEPNADVRVKSEDLMKDLYWSELIGAPESGVSCQEAKPSFPPRSILGNKLNILLPGQPPKLGDNRSTGRTLRKKGALREKGSSNKENNPVKTQDILTPEIVITSSDGRRMHRKMQSQSASNLRKDIFSTPVTPATTTITYAEPVMPNTPSSKSIQSEDGALNNTSPGAERSKTTSHILQRTSTRARADRIFTTSKTDTFASSQPVGNAANIHSFEEGPLESSARIIRHDRWMQENNARELRRIKSDLTMGTVKGKISRRHSEDHLGVDSDLDKRGHARTESYNSMYRRVPPIPAIPESGNEDSDAVDLSNQSSCDTAVQDTEKIYDEFLVGTNAVTRLGKGYQSNICTQNDPTTRLSKKPSQLLSVPGGQNNQNAQGVQSAQNTSNAQNVQKEIKRQPSTNFFLSMRENHFARRKVRQAASFDGFRRPRSPTTQPPAKRPVSAYLAEETPGLPTMPTTPTTNLTNNKEKKRSTVTGAFRKAFYSLLGSEKISK